MKTPVILGTLAILFPLASASVHGQTTPDTATEATMTDDRGTEVRFTLHGGFTHQFDTSIDNGGSFRNSRAHTGISATTPLTPEVELSFRFNYELNLYDFSGSTGIGLIDPWDEVHIANFGAIFSADLSNDLKLFGGPVMQFAAESDAEWKDGFSGGGVGGVTYRLSDDLILGAGIGVVSKLEDDARVFPVIILEWKLSDRLRLSSRPGWSASGNTGLELIYDWGGGWETAAGAAYRYQRFRLSESSTAPSPDGLGEEKSVPIWGRVTYRWDNGSSFSVIAGVAAFADIEVMDDNGSSIQKEDYDPAGFVGAMLTLRF